VSVLFTHARDTFPGLFKEYGDAFLFIYKDYPLEKFIPWAVHAAVNANCLGAQNVMPTGTTADYLHGNQHAISDEKAATARTRNR